MRNERGFTLAELLVVVAIFMTIAAMATALLMSSIVMMRADGEAQRLIGLFQLARETAIMRQRDIELTFDAAANRARLILLDNGAQIPLREISLEYGVAFRQFGGVPDTPDGFGADEAIDFDDAARLIFISDGSLVGADDLPVNGTVFLGIPGRNETARAVTITGATARARVYRWSGAWWEQ